MSKQINCNLIFVSLLRLKKKLKYALVGCYEDEKSILLHESMTLGIFKVNVTAT
jgi:hypothetical protein